METYGKAEQIANEGAGEDLVNDMESFTTEDALGHI